ncbi:glycosyl transferase family 28 (plasmid) [Nostoc sp. NIES-3756]|uniref:glycosyltransferase n=1 Tax=Nostoc sp. NIES-3756 TaxID=1751286 RepID=UPI0007209731|nr:glycosyl transferase family 28 [Nostoc sp. NIES-3756]
MHITILTTGSRGDIQPYLALGLGLRQAGHCVQVATHLPFEALVRNHGLAFGYDIAEKLNIPFFLSSLLPITANSDFPFPTTPPGLRLGRIYNALTYPLIGQILWQTFRTSINRWRQSVL